MATISNNFYILVEGEPHSPEVSLLNGIIADIFSKNDLRFDLHVIEVCSSSSFKSFSKFCYRNSKVHEKIPVLAISDNDYKVRDQNEKHKHSFYIEKQEPKILYWQRHEWENYLLDELDSIVDWLNNLPTSSKGQKPSRKNGTTTSTSELRNCLKEYFKKELKNEFWECLKFNLSPDIKKYPSIKKPDNFDLWSITDIEAWFDSESQKEQASFELKPKSQDLFKKITSDFSWSDFLNNRDTVSLDVGKKIFRGKRFLIYMIF